MFFFAKTVCRLIFVVARGIMGAIFFGGEAVKISDGARRAIMIGSMCSISYLAVYIARNILSAVTPQMLAGGYTEEYIGMISSAYFVTYAVGQLINGAIGDRVKARYMISVGLILAGVANLVFPFVMHLPYAAVAVYSTVGFFLAP